MLSHVNILQQNTVIYCLHNYMRIVVTINHHTDLYDHPGHLSKTTGEKNKV